jgi:DNA-binding NarL/FixJ family response regulator
MVWTVTTARRILIVEDDPAAARALRRVLASIGDVAHASTARDASVILDDGGQWTCVFLDYGLPDETGLEFLRRTRPSHPLLPVMLLTGVLDARVANTAHALRAHYVLKPYDPEWIVAFAREVTALSSAFERVASAWECRYALSGAEADILRRAAVGEDRSTIARARSSSELTIKKHGTNLLRRTGDETLQTAIARLLREVASIPPR